MRMWSKDKGYHDSGIFLSLFSKKSPSTVIIWKTGPSKAFSPELLGDHNFSLKEMTSRSSGCRKLGPVLLGLLDQQQVLKTSPTL